MKRAENGHSVSLGLGRDLVLGLGRDLDVPEQQVSMRHPLIRCQSVISVELKWNVDRSGTFDLANALLISLSPSHHQPIKMSRTNLRRDLIVFDLIKFICTEMCVCGVWAGGHAISVAAAAAAAGAARRGAAASGTGPGSCVLGQAGCGVAPPRAHRKYQ